MSAHVIEPATKKFVYTLQLDSLYRLRVLVNLKGNGSGNATVHVFVQRKRSKDERITLNHHLKGRWVSVTTSFTKSQLKFSARSDMFGYEEITEQEFSEWLKSNGYEDEPIILLFVNRCLANQCRIPFKNC